MPENVAVADRQTDQAPIDPHDDPISQTIERIRVASRTLAEREHEVEQAVLKAWMARHTWADIGSVAGMTRQGAQAHWSTAVQGLTRVETGPELDDVVERNHAAAETSRQLAQAVDRCRTAGIARSAICKAAGVSAKTAAARWGALPADGAYDMGQQALHELRAAAARRSYALEELALSITKAREARFSWHLIGSTLGRSHAVVLKMTKTLLPDAVTAPSGHSQHTEALADALLQWERARAGVRSTAAMARRIGCTWKQIEDATGRRMRP
ncbi:hypothetical protein [Nocardioides sp. GXZ039]|uniref:hypothetical protein n=1 Tax=Nocardioides sp. GXZ039 TaxID=3136018 RepID=UPI0030F38764